MFKIPKTSRDGVFRVLKIGLILFFLAVPIQILSSQLDWVLNNIGLSQRTISYIMFWFSVVPEPTAGFLAIFVAFAMENREKRRLYRNRIREILPYIFFELIENKGHLDDYIHDHTDFMHKARRFNDSNWEMYKDDIKKWSQNDTVAPLSRIYYYLSDLNYKTTRARGELKLAKISKEMVENQIENLNSNYFSIPNYLLELHKAFETYLKIFKIDEALQEIIVSNWPDKLPKEMNKKIVTEVIEYFVNSIDFKAANSRAKLLINYKPFTKDQVNRIIKGFVTNSQINQGYDSKDIVAELYSEYKELIDTDLQRQYEIIAARA